MMGGQKKKFFLAHENVRENVYITGMILNFLGNDPKWVEIVD